MELTVGMVVRAIAGRDGGGFFVVTALDGDYAVIADGKSRPLSRPKRKNTKHLRRTREVLTLDGITDKKLRTALRTFAEPATE